jgi:outer membrane protein assembly factor BamD
VPEADPVALNRMKFEEENRTKAGIVGTSLGILKRGPDVRSAAKSGTPAMTSLRPPVPASVPAPTAGAGFSGDVTAGTVSDSSTLDQGIEARQAVPANSTGATTEPAANPQQTQPLPTNQQQLKQQPKKQQKKQKETKKQTNAPAKTGSPAAEKGNAGGGQSGDAGRD